MHKIAIALGVFVTLFVSTSEAMAQYQRHHHRHHYAPRYYAPPPVHRHHYHRPRASHNWVPYVVGGGIALGALGAGSYYYNNFRTCWYQSQDVYNQWGHYVGTRRVKVCE